MSNKIEKISAEEISRASLDRLANRPTGQAGFGESGLSPQDLKRRLVALARLGVDKVNELVDALGDEQAGSRLLAMLFCDIASEQDDAVRMPLSHWLLRAEERLSAFEDVPGALDDMDRALRTLEGVQVQAELTSQEPRVEVKRTEGEEGDDITLIFYLPKGAQGERGRGLEIAKSYKTLEEMRQDVDNERIAVGELVIVDTHPDTDKEENAAVYIKVQNEDGSFGYNFFVDLSGAVGIKGERGDGVSVVSCLPTAEDFTDTPDSDPSYKFKVCTYDRSEPHLSADLDFRVIVGGYGFRFPFNVQYPYSGKMRTMFVKPRVIFESEENKSIVSLARLYEKPGADTSHRELWLEIKASSAAHKVSALYLDAKTYSNGFSDFAIEPMPYEVYAGMSGYDSTTVFTADWANKTSVLNIDSRATAEGATVGGTGNRVESKNAASFGENGRIESGGTGSMQGGNGNTNRAKNVHQVGENLLNEVGGYNSAQFGSGHKNSGPHTLQSGINNENDKGSDVVQFGHTCKNKGDHVFQHGWECHNEFTKPDGTKDGYNYVDMLGSHLFAARVHQMLRGIYNLEDPRAAAIWANGTANNPRNIFTIAASGTPELPTDGVTLGDVLSLFCETVIMLTCSTMAQLNEVSGKLTEGGVYFINNTRFTAVQGSSGDNIWDYAAPPVGTRFYCKEISSECEVVSHDPGGFVLVPVKDSYCNSTVSVTIRRMLGGGTP